MKAVSMTITKPDFAREAAESVYRYLCRTAERVPTGTRWKTLSYQDEMRYDPCVFNGVAGISLFLADYHALTGSEQALELAVGAANWATHFPHEQRDDSVGYGRAGIGMAWLRLYAATHNHEMLENAAKLATPILQGRPGPKPGFLFGAAGIGLFLLKLWKAGGLQEHLDGAVRQASWLEKEATQGPSGCRWPISADQTTESSAPGFCLGSAGIGHFLLTLYEETRAANWADLAKRAAAYLQECALPDHGGLNWPAKFGEGSEALQCQWCRGAPGVGLFFTKAYGTLNVASYLKTAEAAATATYAYGDVRQNPSQCHGLAGNAELFIEFYRTTRDTVWLDRAREFGGQALQYRRRSSDGEVWQADVPGFTSPDFLCGAAGTGHFYLRVADPDRFTMPLL